VKHHSLLIRILTLKLLASGGQCVQVSLTGAVSSQMSNGGALSLVQHGWQPCVEGMARNQVDCKTYKSSRCESRPK
jgi:hypothetical protein